MKVLLKKHLDKGYILDGFRNGNKVYELHIWRLPEMEKKYMGYILEALWNVVWVTYLVPFKRRKSTLVTYLIPRNGEKVLRVICLTPFKMEKNYFGRYTPLFLQSVACWAPHCFLIWIRILEFRFWMWICIWK